MAYIPSLDGLRGVAISLVMLHHITLNSFPGAIGVDIFFVLSGFLITSILVGESLETKKIKFTAFYRNRFLRLYPSLILMVVLASICALLIGKFDDQFLIDSGITLTYLTPWVLILSNWAGGFYRHTWSLGIEETFYIAWPILFVSFHFIKKLYLLLFTLGAVVLLSPSLFANFNSQLDPEISTYGIRIGGIILGCALALSPQLGSRVINLLSGPLGILGLLCALLVTNNNDAEFLAATSTLFILSSITKKTPDRISIILRKILEQKQLVWIGKISYEIYLVHYVLVISVVWELYGRGYGQLVVRWALVFVGIVSIPLSYLIHSIYKKIRVLAN